jgi:hypothetical protein
MATTNLDQYSKMKEKLRKLCSPLLVHFESGDSDYLYKRSHRVVLVVMGCLFGVLSVSIFIAGISFSQIMALLPGLIFFGVSFTCLVVGILGSNRAVSKIWGSK